ncbi:MAG: DNA translocase FtsK [Chloroflexi bacterium]|nr:DNA translocase FtsK [Chloroflexota bacterium]MBK6711909.1 DNA translocase FtsK [Chloroflexota bacterium]MBK7178057.1 DNA translocase FtsK [Chloroflexota bacterium]MBK7919498.1 DNA translocase FtsK [Chloroflexota bacterium]MBK8931731.1 DNA translocase FtsK [Chloroflexota bacterium]
MLQKQRLQHRIEIQSRQIERVFARHEMAAEVTGGVVGPRAYRYELQAMLTTGWDRLRDAAGDLKTALGVPDVAIRRADGRWQLDVAYKEEPPVALLDVLAMTPQIEPLTAVLGLSEDGRPVLVQFDARGMTHMMVSGMPGAGKTSLIRTIALSLALTNRQSNVQLLVIDPQIGASAPAYTELEPLNYLPHMLTSVIYDVETAADALNFLVNEMAYREETGAAVPNVVVIIDQAAALMEVGGAPIGDAITQLVQHGETVGIHLILSMDEPGAAAIDTILRANLPVRVVGKSADRQAARDAAGRDGSGAENLYGRGDFVAVANGNLVNFQAAYVGNEDLHMSVSQLLRPPMPTLMAHPYLIRPHLDAVSVEEIADDGANVLFFDGNGRLWPSARE